MYSINMSTQQKQRILAFDIGIKNLAFCILEEKTVYRLENVNILGPVEKTVCSGHSIKGKKPCTSSATFSVNGSYVCTRHIPSEYTVIKKAPTLPELKELAKSAGISTVKKTKADILVALSSTHAFPYKQPRQAKASTQSLAELHDALRTFIDRFWPDFQHATHVLLENQPAFKNPHMKSVQVLLFASLRERFLQAGMCPSFHLVHAKKKVADAEAGDAGYAERKSKSEQRVTELFTSGTLSAVNSDTLGSWTTQKKKSDMADAVCMCCDFTWSG